MSLLWAIILFVVPVAILVLAGLFVSFNNLLGD